MIQDKSNNHGRYLRRKKRSPFSSLVFLIIPSLFVIYYEVLFRFFTGGKIFETGFLYTVLFSLVIGCILYLLTTISPKPAVNHYLCSGLLILLAIPYLVEYFIYRQFKVFYDLNTIFGGAADAMGDFRDAAMKLIFSWNGLLTIFLYLAPAIAIAILRWDILFPRKVSAFSRIVCALCGVLIFMATWVLITFSSVYGPIYSKEYNYQAAVSHFGLMTGIRLDAENMLWPKMSDGFEEIPGGESPVIPTLPPETRPADPNMPDTQPPTQPPVEYGWNELNINFDKLISSSSGKIKDLHKYVSSQQASRKNAYTGLFKGKNLIMISAEAFSAEVIDPELTPTLYRLATKGFNFTDYYQPASAGTTGGEYQNIFGLMPTAGGKSFKNTVGHLNYMTMGSQLNRLGYYGQAFHNNSYTFYDRHKTHNNLGYSQGFMGYGNGMEEYVKKQWPQSDYEMMVGTLPLYIDQPHFNVYYMSVSGHSNYDKAGNAMTRKHWDRVAHLDYSDTVKGYLAANLDLEDALTYLVDTLEAKGLADDTVICISADHFPYGLDADNALGNMPFLSELYGENVTNTVFRDHNRLILWCGSLEKNAPVTISSPTSSIDILPTLSNLFGLEFDSRLLPGRDVFSDADALMFNMNYDWKTDLGTYHASKAEFVPNDPDAPIPEGYVKAVKAIVRNKIRYCQGVLETDYYRSIYG